MKLGKLRLKAFRGATQDVTIDFDTSKSITLIFGENGTGKSTIIDGLSFICEQNIGSLADRSGATDKSYLVSAGQKKEDVLVELTIAKDSWTAGFVGNNINVSSTEGLPALRVLRRAQLSSFIEKAPKERYDALKQFIETPNIEKSEQSLREAQKAVDLAVTTLKREQVNTSRQLEELWQKEGSPDASAEVWAKSVAELETALAETEIQDVQNFETEVVKIRASVSALTKCLDDLTLANSSYESARKDLKEQQDKFSSGSNDLLTVIQSAKAYLEKYTDTEACPVCTQSITAETVVDDLATKISGLSELAAASTRVTGTSKTVDATIERCTESLSNLIRDVKSFDDLISREKFSFPLTGEAYKELQNQINNEELTNVQRHAFAAKLSKGLDTKLTAIKASSAENQKKATLKNSVTVYLDDLALKAENITANTTLSGKLSATLKVVEGERKRFVETVFNEISQEISQLYERIHPGESIAEISLNLDNKKRGSLDLAGKFHSESDVPPQAYFSESHLDTLGICIWLAFTKKFAPEKSLLILDDVLTSVDSAHLDRVIHLIDEETEHFCQVILTTHYRLWRDRYRYAQVKNKNIHYIELKEWALERGILVDSNVPMLTELERCLVPATFDRQKVASQSGIFLEFLLDYLALKYQVSLPRMASQDYTLGQLLNAFNSKKRELMYVNRIGDDGGVAESILLKPFLDKIEGFAWIRNQVGCHFTLKGLDVSDSDVRKFGQAVFDFADAIICKHSGDLPTKNKSGSYWESKAGRSHLYPLEMP